MGRRTMKKFAETGTGRKSRAGRLLRNLLRMSLLLVLACFASRSAEGQVVESADAGRAFVWTGASLSGYTLQYGQRKMLGVTAFVDSDTVRRFGLEAEGRWLEYRQTQNVHAETYLGGVRYHFNVGRFQ